MSERKFKEDCYKHFNNKYKVAVKEIDDKYASGYSQLWKLVDEVSMLKNKIKLLEYKLERVDK